MSTITSRNNSPIRLNKVPQIVLTFWIIKILSTTVGETVADFLAVNLGLGLGKTCAFMLAVLCVTLCIQIKSKSYTPWIYWLNVVLLSIVGTQITDVMTDQLGISLYVSTAVFTIMLLGIFLLWYVVEGTLSIHSIDTLRREWFYWAAILCAFALGTAAGDLVTEAFGMGFLWGVGLFGSLIALTYIIYRLGGNAVVTFWIAYILTRPFGAALGDLLTQAQSYGGVGLGAAWTSGIFLSVIVALVGYSQMQNHIPANNIAHKGS